MDLLKLNKVYFLGIGGIGMSALARWFANNGTHIFGYDKTKTKLTEELSKENMQIHYDDNPDLIPEDIELIVYTPAIPKENKEYQFLTNSGIPFLKRSKVLGLISEIYYTIAVSGTHGKTTISSIIAHILNYNNEKLTAFVGGICNNFNSNLVVSNNSNVMVAEADEYDKSFLNLSPDIIIVSSTDADHLDIYGDKNYMLSTFKEFTKKLPEAGHLILNKKVEELKGNQNNTYTYSYQGNSLFTSENIRYNDNEVLFDLKIESKLYKDFSLKIPGQHNVENATAAIAAAYIYGLEIPQIKEAVAEYSGVQRRFDIKHTGKQIYIDDYAHHPEELKACIKAARNMNKGKKITGVFQPHLYSRTRDFANEFAKSLELLDEIILIDIYPAREKPIEGINSKYLLSLINKKDKYFVEKEDLLAFISEKKPEVLLTLGAGNIDKFVEPINKLLKESDEE